MTVNKTPRLGLMSPVDSDPFEAADFANTFSIIDQYPGIAQVNNYNALVNLGNTFTTPHNQHGLMALERDNNALWWWNAPSGSAGTWERANSLGVLSHITQGADVTSGATSGNGAMIWSPAPSPVTLAGGRPVRIDCYVNCSHDNPSGGGVVVLNLMMDSSILRTSYQRPSQAFSDGGPTLSGTDCFVSFYLMTTNPGDTHTFNLRIRSASGSNVSGNATARSAALTVVEV